MEYLPLVFVFLVAFEHFYIMILEMFFWTKPRTLKIFGISKDDAERSKSLAANMGLYNGFLSIGLIWGILHTDSLVGHQIQLFFLSCIIVAAIYGGLTVKKSIIMVQGVPAVVATAFVLLF